MNPHDWSLGWPGCYCKRCGADDPAEMCIGTCDLAPIDDEGYPDPFRCPEHGIYNTEWWDCQGHLPAGPEVKSTGSVSNT